MSAGAECTAFNIVHTAHAMPYLSARCHSSESAEEPTCSDRYNSCFFFQRCSSLTRPHLWQKGLRLIVECNYPATNDDVHTLFSYAHVLRSLLYGCIMLTGRTEKAM